MSELLYDIDELAIELKTTPQAIRQHLFRKNFNAVPPPVKLGRRMVWMKDHVIAWLKERADNSIPTKATTPPTAEKQDEPTPPPPPKKRGRPRKST
jgi:hypothetical protein